MHVVCAPFLCVGCQDTVGTPLQSHLISSNLRLQNCKFCDSVCILLLLNCSALPPGRRERKITKLLPRRRQGSYTTCARTMLLGLA